MSDRSIDVEAASPDQENPATMRYLTQLVLGVSNARLHLIDRARMEIGEEIWERIDPEDASEDGIEIPLDQIVTRAAHHIFDECSVYFRELRDSLQNILLDIETFTAERDLIHSDAFWRNFIIAAVATRKTETQLWDFKQTLTVWHVPNGPAREQAKVAFAEDVASFANARGGVLIVGVSDARKIIGIGDAREAEDRFKVSRDVLARHLEYPDDIISFHQAVLNDDTGTPRLCLAVVVAQTSNVVGVTDGNGHYTYPLRRETGIARVAAAQIAGRKTHIKRDNHDFIRELDQFVREN